MSLCITHALHCKHCYDAININTAKERAEEARAPDASVAREVYADSVIIPTRNNGSLANLILVAHVEF